MKNVPNSWDNTKLLEGYPGKDIIIARQKGNKWYIGGINADNMRKKTRKLSFDFLPEGVKYKLILITDGKHDKEFYTQYLVVNKTSSVDVKLLRRGGFAACLSPVN